MLVENQHLTSALTSEMALFYIGHYFVLVLYSKKFSILHRNLDITVIITYT